MLLVSFQQNHLEDLLSEQLYLKTHRYNDYVGGSVDTDIYSENVPDEDRPWDGETNDFKGYNRIDELKGKVIREARGYS